MSDTKAYYGHPLGASAAIERLGLEGDCAAQDTKRDASDATGHALRGRIQPEKCAIARLAGFFETGWVFVERSCNAGLARNELGPRIAGTASNPL